MANKKSKKCIIPASTNQNFYNEKADDYSELGQVVGESLSLWDIKQYHKEVSLVSFSSRKKQTKKVFWRSDCSTKGQSANTLFMTL